MHDINVIGTLQLLAACERVPTLRDDRRARLGRHVRRRAAGASVLQGGDGPPVPAADALPARRRGDRELLRDLRAQARRRGLHDAALPARDRSRHAHADHALPLAAGLPDLLGFDPRIQLVHIDDALEAIVAAVRNPVRGAVNVAGPGTIGLTRMIRLAGKRACRSPAPVRRRDAPPASGSASTPSPTTSSGCSGTAAAWTRAGSPRRSATRRGTRRWIAVARMGRRRAAGAAGAAAREPMGTAIASCGGCGPGSNPGSSCRRRSARRRRRRSRATRVRPSSGSSTGWTATTREDEWGFDEDFAEARRAVLRVPVRVVVAGGGRGRRARACSRAGAARLEPRGHPALGRHDDLDGPLARAPAAAPPALPGARLGVRPAVRSPARSARSAAWSRRRSTRCACWSRTSSWRSSPRA